MWVMMGLLGMATLSMGTSLAGGVVVVVVVVVVVGGFLAVVICEE